MTKVKIYKTNRVRVRLGESLGAPLVTVYVSYKVVQEVSPICVKVEGNVLVPAKGRNSKVLEELQRLAKALPDHFTSSGLEVLS